MTSALSDGVVRFGHEEMLIADYPDSSWFRSLRTKSLNWFQYNQRQLPWRNQKTPYRIWVSEIMLQQTQVQTVIDYFNRFVEQFPDIPSLAKAKESKVLSLWEGLGYYRRARNLHAAAKQINRIHAGNFPETFEEVITLPGIGRYTAGAILSIAFNQRFPILEGNTYRLHSRLLGLLENPRQKEPEKLLWRFASDALPNEKSKQQPGQLNQSLMEIGSQICTATKPSCSSCPIKSLCAAHRHGLENEIPKSKSKVHYQDRRQALFIIEDDAFRALVRKRKSNEWWSGLWDFVRLDLPENKFAEEKNRNQSKLIAKLLEQETGHKTNVPSNPDFTIRHAVTHYRIQLDCYHIQSNQSVQNGIYQLRSFDKIGRLPLNVTARTAFNRVHDINPVC